MHVPDGLLPPAVVLGGYVAAAGVTALCLERIGRRPDPRRDVPKAAMLTAAFFVASLIQLPLPPTSAHLMLNGLLGIVLGWFAFPAIVVGLALQAIGFGHGGITTLGVNALILGVPALAAFALFGLVRGRAVALEATAGFLVGAGAMAFAVLIFALVVVGHLPAHVDPELERQAVRLFALAHVPLMVVEGIVVALAIVFLRRVSPALLAGR